MNQLVRAQADAYFWLTDYRLTQQEMHEIRLMWNSILPDIRLVILPRTEFVEMGRKALEESEGEET